MSEDEFICVRCSKLGETCCQQAQVLLTKGDVRRIGMSDGGKAMFYQHVAPSDPDYLPTPELDPIWHRAFDAEHKRRILRQGPDGYCIFLTPTGCRLGPEARPRVCLLYPYDYNHETLKGVHAHMCPEPERDNPALILALLGMNRDVAETLRKQLYEELEEEFPG